MDSAPRNNDALLKSFYASTASERINRTVMGLSSETDRENFVEGVEPSRRLSEPCQNYRQSVYCLRETMGQTVGRMPNTWARLLEEKDRVLYWSGEVLARVADNVNQEESFQIDYGDDCIDRKVDLWIQACRDKVGRILCNRRNVSQERRTRVFREIEQVRAELMAKMRKDYYESYSEIRQFTKKVDNLGHQQRRVHAKIHELEDTCAGNVRKFRKKFGPLRVKTFRNLVISERFIFEDRRLKAKFVERIYDIDRKNMKTCAKSVNTLTKM